MVKKIAGFITLLGICYCTAVNAQVVSLPTKLAAYKTSNASTYMVVKKANVVYPTIFTQHANEANDYVEKLGNNRRQYLLRTYTRSKKYFPKTIAILKKYKVPAEFAVLLALESGFNAKAISPAGAVGYWQIMDEVAKEYGLKIIEKEDEKITRAKAKLVKPLPAKPVVDERTNFIKSTTVAARYLKDRQKNLNGDWLLVAASYNCGVGTVWNAIKRSGKPNADFWDIKQFLPSETRAYVMNFIALNVIFHNYKTFLNDDLCFEDIVVKNRVVAID